DRFSFLSRANRRAVVGDDVGGVVAVAPLCAGRPKGGRAERQDEGDDEGVDGAITHNDSNLPAYIFPNVSMRLRAAGPRIAMKSVGNRKQASGNNSFTAAFCAACSARCRRFVRKLSA